MRTPPPSSMGPGSTRALLKRLVGVCYDAQRGYRTAAARAGSMELRRFLARFAAQREEFGEQLAARLDDAAPRGSFQGALHRGWIDLRDRLGCLSQTDLLKECVRGETAAVKQYEDALAARLSDDVMEIVASQLSHVVESRNRIAELVRDGEART